MLSYRARRRLALLILLVGLPVYIVAAVSLMNWLDGRFGRQPIWIEVPVYVVLAFVWALPLRRVFLGIGQADPNAQKGGPDAG